MLVLGIETTCDETACAVVRNGKEILSNAVATQIELHAPWGGVVPELACRSHIDLLPEVIRQALDEAKISLSDLDLIAVAHGPGLIGALLIGLNMAKGLSLGLNKPIIGVNHIQAHLFASLRLRLIWTKRTGMERLLLILRRKEETRVLKYFLRE